MARIGRELPVRFGVSAKRKRTFVGGKIQAALSAPAGWGANPQIRTPSSVVGMRNPQ